MTFEIKLNGNRAEIYTPYSKSYIEKVKLLGGRWDAASRCWSVDADAVEEARAAMREVYGRDDRPVAETVDVELTFTRNIYGQRGPIAILGREIAAAFGRDTGARVGEGVLFLEGRPESGGSMKNWWTAIPEGCVVKLLRVPRPADDAALPDGVTMRVLGSAVDRDALLAEKERLLARLAEIDKLLA